MKLTQRNVVVTINLLCPDSQDTVDKITEIFKLAGSNARALPGVSKAYFTIQKGELFDVEVK